MELRGAKGEPVDLDTAWRDVARRFHGGLVRPGGERRLQRAGPPRRPRLARRCRAARGVALPPPGGGALFASLHVGDARTPSGDRRRIGGVVPCAASIPSGRTKTAASSAPTIEAALEQVESLDEDRIIRRFLNVIGLRRCGPISSSRVGRGAARRDQPEARLATDRRAAGAEAVPRDLRLRRRASKACISASARSRAAASAGRTGRRTSAPRSSASPRRSRSRTRSSCRSAPRAASCPSDCRSAAAATRCSPKAPRPIASSSRGLLDITDNLDGDRVVPPREWSAATTATIPIWWSPPTRAPRPSPTSPIAIADRAWLLARRRLRQRRLGRLRPQEDGDHRARRLGGGQAPFPRDGHRHPDDAVHGCRRRRHVGRRVRQRHAAVAGDQARRRLRSPRHLHRSRPRPDAQSSPSARGCSTCRARAGRTTTSKLISQGRRRVLAPATSRSADARDARARSGSTGRQRTPHEVIRAILKAAVDLLWFGGIGTYRRAPRARADDEVGDRANDAVRITAQRRFAPGWSARAPISA